VKHSYTPSLPFPPSLPAGDRRFSGRAVSLQSIGCWRWRSPPSSAYHLPNRTAIGPSDAARRRIPRCPHHRRAVTHDPADLPASTPVCVRWRRC